VKRQLNAWLCGTCCDEGTYIIILKCQVLNVYYLHEQF